MVNPLTALKGVGEKRAADLNSLDIRSIRDLLDFYPRDYRDYSVRHSLADAAHGDEVVVEVVPTGSPVLRRIRKNLSITELKVTDGVVFAQCVWFNRPYLAKRLPGLPFLAVGRVDRQGKSLRILNPVVETDTARRSLEPVYRVAGGLTQSLVRAVVVQALRNKSLPQDGLPEDFLARYKLCDASYAYRNIHFPSDRRALETARRRIVFEEFLLFQLAAMYAGRRRQRFGGGRIAAGETELAEFEALLPYRLTGAQRRVTLEAYGDLAGDVSMNRLVQGDVGCGKTAVALAAVYACAKSGFQSAFMAPTEILARQHFETCRRLLGQRWRVVLLTSSMSAAERAAAYDQVADGAEIVVGTHALIQQGIAFQRLALAVTDEQHRFGVAQRAALSAKGQSPHLLVMSATPIPRTLALMLYGDLDISVVEELPPGRKPVKTHLVPEARRRDMYAFFMKKIRQGAQAYIVCAAIEKNDEFDARSAEEVFDEVRAGALGDAKVALLHGKLAARQRQQIAADFAAGEIDALVSTTVIEVGLDVPNACVMAVENADRFGLAQLHQLRGRVGRGQEQAYFFMVPQSDSAESRERLETLCATADGFEIAKKDLAMRGPGEFLGQRQHGAAAFKTGSIAKDMETLQEAQQAARALFREGDEAILGLALETHKHRFSDVAMN